MKRTKSNNIRKLKHIRSGETSRGFQRVHFSFLSADKAHPLVVSPGLDGLQLQHWMTKHQSLVEEKLLQHGALLFRGFDIQTIEQFDELARCFGEKLSYEQRTSPRTEVSDRVYTSTEYPADQVINMHSELSYSNEWPMKLVFYCHIQPQIGGETPIASTRQVLHQLSEDVKRDFREKGILYKRILGNGLGLTWQEVFQTDQVEEVEAACRQKKMDFEWKDNHKILILQWRKAAIVEHPKSGEEVWFNHGYFYHLSTYEASLRASLPEEEIPFKTYFGDGSAIPDAAIQEVGKCYQESSVYFSWQKGDVLLVDNMLMAHGRNRFSGERKILVSMSQALSI